MYTEYHREFSGALAREIEYKVYGRGGVPVLAFPCRNGRFYEWEDAGVIHALAGELSAGLIQLFVTDPPDGQVLCPGDPRQRAEHYEAWYHYVTEELTNCVRQINGRNLPPLVTGCGMGAYHAANLFFRRPDLLGGVVALSGVYDTAGLYGGYMDETVYFNDPCASLANLPADHPYVELFRRRPLFFYTGAGTGEDETLRSTGRLTDILEGLDIPVFWQRQGADAGHGYAWWTRQLTTLLAQAAFRAGAR